MRKTLLTILFLNCFIAHSQTATQVYNWKNVSIKGGGYVTGFVYSKAKANILYARTDVGGAYRWDATNKDWICMTDGIEFLGNAQGILSVAADPNDSNKVYLATGLYTASWAPNGVFYYSNDKGNSWGQAALPCKIGGNEAGRGSGERLQVDPNKGNILFLGSQKQGLLKSSDYGKTWSQVTSFPKTNISFVEFDSSSGKKGSATPNIYVSTYDNLSTNDTTKGGMYVSKDGGASWNYLAGQPIKIEPKSYNGDTSTVAIANNLVFAGDNIFITYGNDLAPGCSNGFVMKYNKKTLVWTKIYPVSHNSQGGYSGISVHPTNPNILLVASLGLWWPTDDQLYLTTDGGTTWTNISTGLIFNNNNTPRIGGSFTWATGLKIDPFNPNNAVIGTGNGLYMTFNLSQAFTGQPTTWNYQDGGQEETVTLDLISPPTGVNLLSGVGDINGYRHVNLDQSPVATYDGSGNTSSLDFAESNPNKIVRAHGGGNHGSYSTDQGLTWTAFATLPTGTITSSGQIAVSADGNTILWTPGGLAMSYSTNNGTTWTASTGVTSSLTPYSDRVNSTMFYAFEASTGKFFKSVDGGKTFAVTASTLPTNSSAANVSCVFGKQGDIWIAAGANGLYHTTDAGATFTKVSTVSVALNVTVGKSATAAGYPALFVHGTIGGISALFRSDDQGTTWKQINNNLQVYGGFNVMAGDQRIYGRLYVGTGGRGILYGDYAGDGTCVMPVLGPDFTLCSSPTATLSANISDAAYSYTWTRNGVALSQTSKQLTISDSGTYRVTAVKTGCPSVWDEINVSTNLVNVADDTVCAGNNATLMAIGTGTYKWYNASTVGTLLDSGSTFVVSPTKTTTYYVQDVKTTSYSLGIPNYTSGGWGLGGAFSNDQNRMQMTITAPLWLKSIALQVTSKGTKGVIRITDGNGNVVVADSLLNLAIGKQAIPFNVILQAGTYFIDAVGTTGSVQFQSDRTGAVFTLPNYVTLTPLAGWAWGIFFDFQFQVGNVCARTPVTITVNALPSVSITSPSNNAKLSANNVIISATATGGTISNVSFYENGALIGSDATIPYSYSASNLANGSYVFSAVAKNSNNCADTAKVNVTINKIVTGVESQTTIEETVLCYPNPYSSAFTIVAKGDFSYSVCDMAGNEVEKGSGQEIATAGQSLPVGMYLLKIYGSQAGNKVLKVTKAN